MRPVRAAKEGSHVHQQTEIAHGLYVLKREGEEGMGTRGINKGGMVGRTE